MRLSVVDGFTASVAAADEMLFVRTRARKCLRSVQFKSRRDACLVTRIRPCSDGVYGSTEALGETLVRISAAVQGKIALLADTRIMANYAQHRPGTPAIGGPVIPAKNSDATDPDKLPDQQAGEEVLTGILDQLTEVRQLTEQRGLGMLKYLLDMAVLEAKAGLEQAKNGKPQQPNGL